MSSDKPIINFWQIFHLCQFSFLFSAKFWAYLFISLALSHPLALSLSLSLSLSLLSLSLSHSHVLPQSTRTIFQMKKKKMRKKHLIKSFESNFWESFIVVQQYLLNGCATIQKKCIKMINILIFSIHANLQAKSVVIKFLEKGVMQHLLDGQFKDTLPRGEKLRIKMNQHPAGIYSTTSWSWGLQSTALLQSLHLINQDSPQKVVLQWRWKKGEKIN